MNTFLEILQPVGVGVLGILFYTLWKSRKYFMEWKPYKGILPKRIKKWSFQTMANENAGVWLWSFMIISIVATITVMVPEAIKGVSEFMAIEIQDSASFFIIGLTLCAMGKSKSNERTGTK